MNSSKILWRFGVITYDMQFSRIFEAQLFLTNARTNILSIAIDCAPRVFSRDDDHRCKIEKSTYHVRVHCDLLAHTSTSSSQGQSWSSIHHYPLLHHRLEQCLPCLHNFFLRPFPKFLTCFDISCAFASPTPTAGLSHWCVIFSVLKLFLLRSGCCP